MRNSENGSFDSSTVKSARMWRVLRTAVCATGLAGIPFLAAYAGSVSIPVVRDNVTGAISSTTAPLVDPINKETAKITGPASAIQPKIGETTAPINDSAMFRANTALQNQVASGSAGYITP
ncbi:hypothetical protein WM40_20245 [Robbsia andropogonis]|uniref:Uncharacterized protein n=1 Tax=Robbsia andropogonis TaxID=28092 RepID=A0A0F5JW81_9BURK|nr:hypothetical protein [Robbsia andropogonis]KKB61919.1 hypothetical protein WM40_20245 [Robbsia andropogonis]